MPERPNGTVSKTVVGVCLPWVQIPPLPPLYADLLGRLTLTQEERHAAIGRYVNAIHDVGKVVIWGKSLREHLTEGRSDLWSSSELRESSIWRDPTLFDQLSLVTGHTASNQRIKSRPALNLFRAVLAWSRALTHSLKKPKLSPLEVDVVFVQYWPTNSEIDVARVTEWKSPYFQNLPSALVASGMSVGFLHVHSDGPVTKLPPPTRRAQRALKDASSPHRFIVDGLTLREWFRALRDWIRIVVSAPRSREVESRLLDTSDARTLWSWWRPKYDRSVFGSHGVRSALLSQMFSNLLERSPSVRLWVVASEGQSWEACLAKQLNSASARWLPYLHTMMRPWDLRAHTFLREVAPKMLAIHGAYDRSELSDQQVPLVEVEALRYQHLGSPGAHLRSHGQEKRLAEERTWLIVGGADCTASKVESETIVRAMDVRAVRRRVVVKPHPQCGDPTLRSNRPVEISRASLDHLTSQADAAIVVGSAAPLDTYLAGLPTCAIETTSGFSMTPIAEDDWFRIARDGSEAVTWLLQRESQRNTDTNVSRFFVIDPKLTRWLSLIRQLTT